MLNTFKIYNQLKENMEPAAAEAVVEALGSVFEELHNSVTKTEFNELRDIVKQQAENISLLTERMDQSVVRMDQLTDRVDDLTVNMAKLTERVDQLAVRMDQLTERVDQLAVRMDQLTERMDQLTERVDQLASNMLKLENKVDSLVGEMKNFKEQLGGLSHTVGYRLEDESYIKLPAILERDHSVVVKGRLKRGWLELRKNKYIELNIWGQAERHGKPVEIIGEAKSQLKKRDVDNFLENLDLIRPHFNREIYPICITYQTSPAVLKYSKDKGLTLFFSYELDQWEDRR